MRAIAIATDQRMKLEESLGATTSVVKREEVDGLWVAGDSVILGIRASLSQSHPISVMNARIGRQAPELLSVILQDREQATGATVIFNLGNNNALTREQVTSIFDAVKDQPRAIAINTAVPRPWREGNNALIAEVAAQYPNVILIDWNSISEGHPEYFAPDGVHLVPAGVAVYVSEIKKYLE